MMDIVQYLLQFIYFVIPGFIARSMIEHLTNKKLDQQINIILNTFLASTVSFTFGNLILELMNMCLKNPFNVTNVPLILSNGEVSMNSLISAVFTSLALSLLCVWCIDGNIIFKIANKLKITTRTDNNDVWDVLLLNSTWIIYRDYVTGYSYFGQVLQFSDTKEIKEILLHEVSVSDEFGEPLYKMEKIYIARNLSEFSIEIDNYKKGEKYEQQEEATHGCEENNRIMST